MYGGVQVVEKEKGKKDTQQDGCTHYLGKHNHHAAEFAIPALILLIDYAHDCS